ncbi:anhydro-N-acetylmuramic acid kinase [Alginatibacterium sediminis]|uniref:Anhydro-N-acetylmuramic acid kinase n=1 Tax=Alginatibacterium sediminis TaxID=2164068 RepID=A0A420E8R8_9ALTE|nr:anhydro-N-acetylmuramic acid kinase [Alginatibacterium sediminis]RKF15825.1 anhydro-N-acetylmuramic acid kinase [Alginatibacterium sediminis]
MTVYVMGMMSGTSIDGVDGVILRFDNNTADASSFEIHAAASVDFPKPLAQRLNLLCSPAENEVANIAWSNVELAKLYAQLAKVLLEQSGLEAGDIKAIGCHGQTIRHFPELGYSMQIGSPAHLAAFSQIPVIADFRNADMARGGEGAPLVPAFHRALLDTISERNRYVLNLGGIANVTVLSASQPLLGFDTGPANTLLDYWYRSHQSEGYYDSAGLWGRQGQLIDELLTKLMQEPYFQREAPKSTGRELFNPQWLQSRLTNHDYAPQDVQRTLYHLTAKSIADALAPFSPGDIYVCGGGANNPLLLELISDYLPNFSVDDIATLGIDPQWVEASAFAWLAQQYLANKPGNVPEVTGASSEAILGAYYPSNA